MKIFNRVAGFLLFFAQTFGSAGAHPHVFIEARLRIYIDKEGYLEKLVEDWQFDPIFSSGVLMDFSKNKQNFTPTEKKKLHSTIYKSMAYFDYFQSVHKGGEKIKMAPPYIFDLSYDKIFKIHLETKSKQPLKFEKGSHYSIRVLDPSFYVNVAYKKNSDITVQGLPAYCKARIIRPDPDQILTRDAQTLSEDFFADPNNAFDLASQLATRLEITC